MQLVVLESRRLLQITQALRLGDAMAQILVLLQQLP